jgi:hypothetical protein
MGNTLISSNTRGLKTTNQPGENTILQDYIKNWAMSDYSVHPDINMSKPVNQQQLKKRACCTQQTDVAIGLPAFDKNGKFVPVMPVNIPIFNRPEDANDANCNLPYDDDGTSKSYKMIYDKNMEAQPTCKNIMTNICNYVKENRKNYTVAGERLYGSLTSDRDDQSSDLPLYNPYYDCNCINSVAKDPKFKTFFSGDSELDKETNAQNLDKRCSGMRPQSWRPKNLEKESMCINNVNIINSNVDLSDQASLNLNQSCNINGKTETLDETRARLAREKAEAERKEAEKKAAEKAAADKALADRLAAEKAAADKLAADKAAAEKAEADRKAAEKAAAEKAIADKLAAEKAEAERKAAEKLAMEKALADKAAADKLAAEEASKKMRLMIAAGGVVVVVGVVAYFIMKKKPVVESE